MQNVKNWSEEYKNLKHGLRKRVACVSLAGIVLALTSCQPSKSVIRERAVQVPIIKTEQVWNYKIDTLYRYETDSILVETLVSDTVIRQRIETKPLYITVFDTVFISGKNELVNAENKRLKEETKRLKKENKKADKLNTSMALAYALGLIGLFGLLWASRREK